jgi:Family of unknown function (DUF5317)
VILLAAMLFVLPLTVIAHGQPRRLADARLTAGRYVATGLAMQIAILETPLRYAPQGALALVHVTSYLLIAVFFYKNRHVPGLVVLGLGGASNFAAIASNNGIMPATHWAVRTAGLRGQAHGFTNSAAHGRTALWFLGDTFAIPRSWPLANVFSIGDVIILIGVAIFLYRTTHASAQRDSHLQYSNL